MRSGWKIAKLGNLASYVNGYPFKPTDWEEEGLPIIRIQNLNSARDEYHYFKGTILPRYKVCKGDILISWSASLGVYTWDGPDALLNQHIFKVVFDKEQINKEFFVYAVSYKLDEMKKLVHGATMQHITRGKFDGIDIPVPSLPEQQRVVGVLDQEFAKIEALKANAEKSLQAAQNLFRKSMDILLTPKADWTKVRLGEICSKIGSGATPSGGKRAYQNEGICLIRSLNVHNNEFRYEELAHINSIQASLLDNVEIHSGDVLFNITGASVARCCLAPDDVIPARVNQHVSILRPLPDTIVPALLVFIMISPFQNVLLMKTAENGATRQAITKKELEEWCIQYPKAKKEQEEIISRLNDLDVKCKTLQENYQKTLSLCDDLKQALLRKAFNGEL